MENLDFDKLDLKLKELGMSDSGIEFAPHMREPFDEVIEELNKIKRQLSMTERDKDWYFDFE